MTLLLSKVAWDHPPTVLGYRQLVVRRTTWLLGLGAAFAVSLVCLCLGRFRPATLVFIPVVIGALPILPWVLITYLRRRRVAAVLRAYPWHEFPCRHPRLVAGGPATIAVSFSDGFTAHFKIIPFPIALAERENDHPDRIWFAGDPRFGGVVSPVGGHYPVRVVPDKVPAEGWIGGDDGLALRVGLMRRSGKGTQT